VSGVNAVPRKVELDSVSSFRQPVSSLVVRL
jgi:hypothetical protein